MIHTLSSNHEWFKHPAFYNAYPIRNEVTLGRDGLQNSSPPYGEVFIDDYYGRIWDQEGSGLIAKYGRSSNMNHYISIPSLDIVDELRVPYRRVPIYRADNLDVIERIYQETKATNPGYEMLLRGQTKTYLIERDSAESEHFFGEAKVREPSFLPSHLRHSFDPLFLKCMWQSQASILLNDLAYDIRARSGVEAGRTFLQKADAFRSSSAFILFALGIAQHYGLPSVGLDLTDRLDVACWFATRTISTDASGKAAIGAAPSSPENSPTVFIFRCPKDAVFNYEHAKPEGLPEGRPDRQGAWFGYVGWGAASNQLGSYLVCGFRLDPEVAAEIDPSLDSKLFPSRSEDPVLDYFMKMRNIGKYEREALRALQGVYHTTD